MNVLTESEALELVHAHLGRAAQDPLEIAVVLEAWGGVAPELSLPLAEAIAPKAISLPSGPERRCRSGRPIGRWPSATSGS